jgi:hypothetical protein
VDAAVFVIDTDYTVPGHQVKASFFACYLWRQHLAVGASGMIGSSCWTVQADVRQNTVAWQAASGSHNLWQQQKGPLARASNELKATSMAASGTFCIKRYILALSSPSSRPKFLMVPE